MQDGAPVHLDYTLSRSKFETSVANSIEATMKPTRQAIKDAGLKSEQIDKIILVGGSTRVPAVQSAIEEYTGKSPFKGINLDEAVALGAALQAGIISGDDSVSDILLLDVTPLTLGIETLGGVTTTMIERNTTIPTRRSETFSTAADNQPAVEIHVLQGEREFAKDNITLGQFHLVEFHQPQEEHLKSRLHSISMQTESLASAPKTLELGKNNPSRLNPTSLSEDDIQAKIAEAEEFAEADKERKAKVELRNMADQIVYQTRKTLMMQAINLMMKKLRQCLRN